MIKFEDERLPTIGHIKVGEKGQVITSGKGNKFSPPKKIDHFKVTTIEREEQSKDANYKLDMEAMKGIEQFNHRKIPIMFMFDDIESNFNTWHGFATAKGRYFCRSDDGKTAERYPQYNNGKIVEENTFDAKPDFTKLPARVECDINTCYYRNTMYNGAKLCKTHSRLDVILPFVKKIGGVYTFRSTSWHTANALTSNMKTLYYLTGGRLTAIECFLNVTMKTTRYTNADGVDSMTTFPMVHISYEGHTVREIKEIVARHLQQNNAAMSLLQSHLGGKTLSRDEMMEFTPEVIQYGDKVSLLQDDTPLDLDEIVVEEEIESETHDEGKNDHESVEEPKEEEKPSII